MAIRKTQTIEIDLTDPINSDWLHAKRLQDKAEKGYKEAEKELKKLEKVKTHEI